MRIAQLAPLAESVPPKLYGGTERVVAWLVDELVDLGHEVTLFASGDSLTKESLFPFGHGRCVSAAEAPIPMRPAPFLSKRSRNGHPSSTSSTHTSIGCRCRCSVVRKRRFSRPCMAGWTFRDCPISFASFLKQASFRFPIVSANNFLTRNGLRRSTTSCRQACFELRTTKDPTWLSWGV